MTNTTSPKMAKRALVLTLVLAAIVLAGIVLFFVFGSVAEPLAGATTTTTAVS
jgi:hypothetical protein